jgi:hypothetical protein
MSTQQASFTVKSSHRFVNPPVEETPAPSPSSYYYSSSSTKSVQLQQPKGWTNTDTDRKEGSAKGMVIRTTNTSVEDFY